MKHSSTKVIHYIRFFLIVSMTLSFSVIRLDAKKKKPSNGPQRWEQAIQNFEALDKKNPTSGKSILFIGGSNIRRWNLKENFPDLPVINRGFGGSMISEANHFLDRIVLPHQPHTIILYGGANDMSRGRKTPQQVLSDYKIFVKQIHKHLPKTRIIYMSLPHFYRNRNQPDQITKVNRVNELIHEETSKNKQLYFVEINKMMEDKEGKPRKDLFVKDGVHVTKAGYKIWADKLRPLMKIN